MSAVVHHPFQRITIDVPVEDYPRDSLFLPDSPSWATTLISQNAYLPRPQKIPSDVTSQETDLVTVGRNRGIIAEIFDRTSLNIHFDISCFDELDDQLLLAPRDSFAEACWATIDDDSDLGVGPSTPTLSSHHLHSDEEDDVHSDSDETFGDEYDELVTPIQPGIVMSDAQLYDALYKAVYTPDEDIQFEYDRKSFIAFDPPITYAKPQEAVNFFPNHIARPTQRPTLSTRFASFCNRRLRTGPT